MLDRALGAIEAQLEDLGDRVQVCVSDNGSEDDTQAVLARHREILGEALTSYRFERNRGFTDNLLKAVEIADGDFCWLMGSDDVIEPGGLAGVLELLDRHPDLSGITTNRRNVNVDEPDGDGLGDDPRVLPPPGRTGYDSAREVFEELAMLQDYISTQIVSRTRWLAAVEAIGPAGVADGRNFPHLPIIGEMVRRHPRWHWHAEPVVRHRVGQQALPEEWGQDMVDYVARVTDDRARIWSALFGRRSKLYRSVMRRMFITQGNPSILLLYKQQRGQTVRHDVRLLATMARHYWFVRELWGLSGLVLLIPHQLVPPSISVALRLRTWRSGA